jgi:CheY-like chemotaxis protein
MRKPKDKDQWLVSQTQTGEIPISAALTKNAQVPESRESISGRVTKVDVDFNFINARAMNNEAKTELDSPLDAGRNSAADLILVVDDNSLVLETIVRALHEKGYSLLSATTGGWALELFRRYSNKIPVAILDECMPDITGQELIRQIHAWNPQTKMVLTSGYYGDDGHPPLLDKNYAVFLHKPYNLHTLFAHIEASLEGYRAAAQGSHGQSHEHQ